MNYAREILPKEIKLKTIVEINTGGGECYYLCNLSINLIIPKQNKKIYKKSHSRFFLRLLPID
jgi:hypothetical protein